MKCILLIYSLLSNNFNKFNNLNRILKHKKIKKDDLLFNGYDQRYSTNKTEICHKFNETVIKTHIYNEEETTLEQLFKFKKMYFQLELLNYLNKTNDSEINKLLALENYEKQFNTDTDKSPYKPNLFAGGLFTDWNRDNEF